MLSTFFGGIIKMLHFLLNFSNEYKKASEWTFSNNFKIKDIYISSIKSFTIHLLHINQRLGRSGGQFARFQLRRSKFESCWSLHFFFVLEKNHINQKEAVGRSPDLVVMGDDSCLRGFEFESWRCILDGHDIFHIVEKNVLFAWKEQK